MVKTKKVQLHKTEKCGSWYEMRSISCQMEVNSRHVAMERLCQLHEAEYVKRWSFCTHWTEGTDNTSLYVL